jgi:heme ABC exporter ATP-binding subunit CcmA
MDRFLPRGLVPAVELRGVVALASGHPLLAGVNLRVARGEVVGLVGPNGAGKTSVLRLVAGLVPLASGEASVLGVSLRRQPEARAALRGRVGYVGYEPGLYEELTVEENVRFFLRAARGPARAACELPPLLSVRAGDVAGALELVGLGGALARRPARRLSAGQRKRARLAVLVALRPELWLLDEPHASLDAEARALLDAVVRAAAAAGAAVLIASHEPEALATLADRVAVLSGGRIAQVRAREAWFAPMRPVADRTVAGAADEGRTSDARTRAGAPRAAAIGAFDVTNAVTKPVEVGGVG